MTDLVAVDVGNTETHFGVFSGDALLGRMALTTRVPLTVDEAEAQLRLVLGSLVRGASPRGAILSCVVPTLTGAWRGALARLSETRPLVVGPGLRTGMRMRYNDPSEVGPDRVADIVAARETYGAPVVAVDLGTTTNVEVVDAGGSFLGGVIAPGMRLGIGALAEAAARLPLIEAEAPQNVIGRSTKEAMQSGVVFGEAARIDGLLDGVLAELGGDAPIVLTGNDASFVAGLLRHEAVVDESLTLRGLALVWKRNQRGHGTAAR